MLDEEDKKYIKEQIGKEGSAVFICLVLTAIIFRGCHCFGF